MLNTDCSQPFYFSTHAKEEASEVSASTKHQDLRGRGGGHGTNSVSPLHRQVSRFMMYGVPFSGDSTRALKDRVRN